MKIIFLFVILVVAEGIPILTMISDGDCLGTRVIEIYAQGEVDFSFYELEVERRTQWTRYTTLSGIITNEFVYVFGSGDGYTFMSEYGGVVNSIEGDSYAMFNGNDRIRIVEIGGTVIDQYSGSGNSWKYKDAYTKRIDGSLPSGGFMEHDWHVPISIDGQGSCNGGQMLADVQNIGSYQACFADACGVCDGDNSSCSGCTNPDAAEYDLTATIDDGSCSILGCTNPNADNYNRDATDDDGSCLASGCIYHGAENYDLLNTIGDGSCVFSGCTESSALNFLPYANNNDGSCVFEDKICPKTEEELRLAYQALGEC